MQKLKRGTAAIALVATLGLVMPASFGGPASADISSKRGNQPMTIECDLDGVKANGKEYKSKVNSRDNEFTTGSDHDNSNNTTEGGVRFKFTTLQDLNSNLVFTPRSGGVTSIYTAIENRELFPAGDAYPVDDDSDGDAAVPLEADDPRLDGGAPGLADNYPVIFKITADNPYAYFLGGFSVGQSIKKTTLVDCDVTDVGQANPGDTCIANGGELVQGELLDPPVCFQNWYPVGDAEAEVEDCFVGGVEQDECFVPSVFVPDDPDTEDVDETATVTYHYTDIFHIRAQVSRSNGANAQALRVDDGGKQGADRAHKGKHRGKDKRGR